MYAEIVELIRETAKQVNPDGTFTHGSTLQDSLTHDSPGDWIFLPPFNTVYLPQSDNLSTHNLTVVFARQDAHDSTPEQQESIISQMDKITRRFINLLDINEQLQINNVTLAPVYRDAMVVKSGYRATFSLILNSDVC